MRRSFAITFIIVVLSACTSTSDNSGSSPHPAASQQATVPTAPATITAVTPTVLPTPPASSSPSETRIGPGTVTITNVDRIRVRSAPAIGDDSTMYDPLLPEGTTLFVLDGPVEAAGYDWYEVVPISSLLRDAEYGWVAAASRDGVPWLVPGHADCPVVPRTLAHLRGLAAGTRLACFAAVPITVEARLIRFDGDVDHAYRLEPSWFNDGPGYPPHLLIDPTERDADATGAWFGVHLDPAGAFVDPLPLGKVRVTGLFDHPAAQACELTTFEPTTITNPDPRCRWQFAITTLVAVGP